jgi:hypothetical protein
MIVIPKEPISYSGEGSAVDNYYNPQKNQSPPQENWAGFDPKNTKHMAILSLCRQAQWTVSHRRHGEVADLIRLNNWLHSDKCPVNKALKKMDNSELSKIITALEGIVKSKYK